MELTTDRIKEIFAGRRGGAEEFYKFFSILIPVVEREGQLHILYEVRGKNLTRQPGEICFPGGEIEKGESPGQCALRETWEEIGIAPDKIDLVAQLDTIYTYSNFAMHCFLGILDIEDVKDLSLSPLEVDEIFLVALEDLLNAEPQIYTVKTIPQVPEDFPYEKVTGGERYKWRGGKAPVPVYEMGDRVIWGLTARITKRFVDEIKGGELCLE